jgi:hypothetical protein
MAGSFYRFLARIKINDFPSTNEFSSKSNNKKTIYGTTGRETRHDVTQKDDAVASAKGN